MGLRSWIYCDIVKSVTRICLMEPLLPPQMICQIQISSLRIRIRICGLECSDRRGIYPVTDHLLSSKIMIHES